MDDSPQFEPPVTAAPGGTSGLPREPPSSFSFRDRGNKRCIDKQAGEYQGSWRHISELWWDVLCPAMIPIGVYWPLGVVVGINQPLLVARLHCCQILTANKPTGRSGHKAFSHTDE
jgi:hypothetical protein